jgi:hypothetical protein
MIAEIIAILLMSVAVEAISEIITSSEIMRPFRDFIKKSIYPIDGPPKDNWLQALLVWFDKLISCGYCTSVWVAGFLSLFILPSAFPVIASTTNYSIVNWLIITFVSHRLATCFHVVYELIRKGRVKTYDLDILHRRVIDGGAGASTSERRSEVESGDFETSAG